MTDRECETTARLRPISRTRFTLVVERTLRCPVSSTAPSFMPARVAVGTAVLGGATILGAAFNGASFLDFNQDYSSMILAGLFALALGSGQAVTEPVRRVAGRPAGHSALEHPVVASCGRRGGAVAAPGDRAYPATSHHQVCARFGVARSVCAGRAGTETA